MASIRRSTSSGVGELSKTDIYSFIHTALVMCYHSAMNHMTDLIVKKRELLALAEAEAKKLRNQIATLEEMAAGGDFAQYLEEKKAASMPTAPAPARPTNPVAHTVAQTATQSGRNPKGLIRREILKSLADGIERDLDYIENAMNSVTPNKVGRPALRAFLMNLRKDGEVSSRKAGLFQRVQKGEELTGSNPLASSV